VSILNRFAPTGSSSITHPSIDHHSIAVPLHTNGNHWAASCRRKLHGEVYFLYADDLNIDRTEKQVKSALATIPGFMPANAIWINCANNTYLPHSNKCGPRTIISLAVFLSDPAPSMTMLQHYMNANLAMQARTWMGHLLLMGQSPLSVNQGKYPKQAESQSPIDYDTKEDCNLSSRSSIADLAPSAINNVALAQIHKKPQHNSRRIGKSSRCKLI
jgi:hypothetical protein